MKYIEDRTFERIEEDKLFKYTNIISKKNKFNVKMNNNNLYIHISSKSLITIIQKGELSTEEHILFSYYLSNEFKHLQFIALLQERKRKADSFLHIDNQLALSLYDNILDMLNQFKNIPLNAETMKKIIQLKRSILSNKSEIHYLNKEYKKSLDIDQSIITELDEQFAQSYGRIITIYLDNNDIDKANEYFEKMKMKIPKQIIDTQYKAIIERMGMYNKSVCKYKEKIIVDDMNESKRDYWSLFVNGVLLITSGITITLLYRYKKVLL